MYRAILTKQSPFKCTCDNDGPRWTRDNQCCPGCWAMSLDLHQQFDKGHFKPVTFATVERAENRHGINLEQLKINKAIELHERCHKAARATFGHRWEYNH